MEQIECELRSFIDEEKYFELIRKFRKEGESIADDDQVTYYFDVPQDLRIQKNNSYAKIWLKKGKLHDEAREEIEVHFSKDDFDNLEKIFSTIGINPEIKWFRKRNEFSWQGIKVCVDCTKGYGYILELERMATVKEKDSSLAALKEKLQELGVKETPKEIFDQRFEHYKKHWRSLVGGDK
jgi:predicted adenylyl cyclase CyaB